MPRPYVLSSVPCLPCCCRTTEVDKEMRDELLSDIAPRYRPQDYSLLWHNCNHFSHEYGQLLTGEGLPVSEEWQVAQCVPSAQPVTACCSLSCLACYRLLRRHPSSTAADKTLFVSSQTILRSQYFTCRGTLHTSLKIGCTFCCTPLACLTSLASVI